MSVFGKIIFVKLEQTRDVLSMRLSIKDGLRSFEISCELFGLGSDRHTHWCIGKTKIFDLRLTQLI